MEREELHKMLRRERRRAKIESLICAVITLHGFRVRKFSGAIVCRRCGKVMGRWR